jgi:hypothetical protein
MATVNTTWTSPASATLDKATGGTIDEAMTDALASNFYNLGGTAGFIGARVCNLTTQSTTTGVAFTVAFNTTRWQSDPNGTIHSDSVNNTRLTCRTAGVYHIGCNIEWAANATGDRRVWIHVNDSATYAFASQNAVAGGTNTQQNINTSILLAANDYVQVAVIQTSGGALNVSATANALECEFWMTKA